MYWNLKEKKRVYQTSGALKTVIFSLFGKIVKTIFLPSPLLPWNLPMNFHQKVVFLHLESMPFKIKQRKRGVSGWKVGQTWHRNNCSHAKSTTKIYRHCSVAKRIFFLPYLRQAAKIYVSTSYSVVRQEIIEISEQRTAFVWFFAQEVDWCMINCDKQRLQTSVSINLWKILAGHTGDWFDVKTASICTTELWDALKSFILTSLKFKVAPYPIIVSLDTLRCPGTLFISHENAIFLFSVFRVVQGEAKTPNIMGCCRANFAFLHALKIGTFRGKWTLEWVIKTSHFVLLHGSLFFYHQ